MKVLLVEDDPAMRQTLERSLRRQGWLVNSCADGAQALGQWQRLTPDVVLLDLSLPGRDGLQVLGDARASGLNTPVLILTARGTVGDRILGLNTGADDYLPKPFDLDELEARVRALVRSRGLAHPTSGSADARSQGADHLGEYCGIRMDRTSGAFFSHDRPLELSPREAAMLAALMERPGQALGKERLFERVFAAQHEVQIEAVEVVAYRLRRKLMDTGAQLVTLRGLGYLLRPSLGKTAS